MERVLLEALEDGVLTLTMNREERLNAFTPELLQLLEAALTQAASDGDVGVIILRGAGRAFSSGGDVKAMAESGTRQMTYDERVQSLRRRVEVSRLLHEIPKPTIAMLRGGVAGAGLSLALACDLRIGSTTLRLTTAFAKVALSGDFGGSYFLTRLVGPAKARELYFASPILGAEEAQALGLLNRVVPDERLESETQDFARSLARGPRVALTYMKQTLNLAEDAGLAEVLDAESLRHIRCTDTDDHREAAAAFVEKRPPQFRGR